MNLYRIVGSCTMVEYRSIAIEAKNKEHALELAKEELKNESFCYLNWELIDFIEIDNFEIIEASLITPTSQHSS